MDCWASVSNKVSNLINKELTKTLALGEIKSAIAAMPKGKAPAGTFSQWSSSKRTLKMWRPPYFRHTKQCWSLGTPLNSSIKV